MPCMHFYEGKVRGMQLTELIAEIGKDMLLQIMPVGRLPEAKARLPKPAAQLPEDPMPASLRFWRSCEKCCLRVVLCLPAS